MALITDPDLLNQATEVVISTGAKTIQLIAAGNLVADDGVTLQALYSFLKEEWRTDAALIKFPFPLVAVTSEQFEFVSDWEPADDTSRGMIRNAGWREISAAAALKREYAGVITLGSLGGSDQPYFQQVGGGAAADFGFPGVVNEAVQTFGDASNGSFDRRTYLKLFAREQGKLYAVSTLTDIGVTTLTDQAYRFPLANAADLKITHSDATIAADAPYTGITITYHATGQTRSIGGVDRTFKIIIDGNGATAEQIYEKVQYLLRQNSDIDAGAGSVTGKTADALLLFTGDSLKTLQTSAGQGVYIDDFQVGDTNRLSFTDDGGTVRAFPFVASGTINFNANLVADASAKFWMFFTTLPGGSNDFGESGAVIVDDGAGADIAGNVSGASSIAFSFAYDSNVQGGRTAATDAAVTVVAIGLATGQYVVQTHTITRSVGQSISLAAALERNYANA